MSRGGRDEDAEWKRIQKETFTRWCNEHLKKQDAVTIIANLATDLSDGVRLIVLLELLSEKKLGRYSKKPRVHAQRMENVELALNFITKKEGLRLVNIGEWVCSIARVLTLTACAHLPLAAGAGDIEGGNLKLILGLIWTLILHYQISRAGVGFDDKTQKGGKSGGPKQALLAWVQVGDEC